MQTDTCDCASAHHGSLPRLHACKSKLRACSDTSADFTLLLPRVQATADLYNKLGLPEHEAMEAFVRYDPHSPSRLFKQAPAAEPVT